MRIAIAVWFKAPLGGLQENVRATAISLLAAGDEPVVFCPPGPFADSLRTQGIAARSLCFADPDLLAGLRDEPPFDIVHAHPGTIRKFGLPLAEQAESAFFATFHGRWLDAIHACADRCDGIIAVSPAVRDAILSVAPKANGKVTVIPNATVSSIRQHLARLSRNAFRLASGSPLLRIVVASRFDSDKRRLTDFLLSAWKEQAHRDAYDLTWQVAGGGSDMDELIEAADKLDAALGRRVVSFLGWLNQHDLAKAYAESDVAVAPGRSAIDAMAHGLPVIAVGSAGCAGLATPDRFEEIAYANFGGFGLINERAPSTVVSELIRLQEKRSRLLKLSYESSRFSRLRFCQVKQNERLMELYREAISKR